MKKFPILILSLLFITCLVKCGEILFEFNFDNITDYADFSEYAGGIGITFLAFLDQYLYQPDSSDDLTELLLTDYTSISSPTTNDELCQIPFDFDDRENHFCVENPNPLDIGFSMCLTENDEFANCNQGNFLLVRPTRAGNLFNASIGFFQPLNLDDDEYYEVEFYYTINPFGCSRDSIGLSVSLKDEVFYSELLFNSSLASAEPSNTQWNLVKQCFQVYKREYSLYLNAFSSCDMSGTLVAVDEIYVRRLDLEEIAQPDECLKIQVTSEQPTTTRSTTIPNTEPATSHDESSSSSTLEVNDSTQDRTEYSFNDTATSPTDEQSRQTSTVLTSKEKFEESTYQTVEPQTEKSTSQSVKPQTEEEFETTTTEPDDPQERTPFPTYLIIIISIAGFIVLIGFAIFLFYLYHRCLKSNSANVHLTNSDIESKIETTNV